MMMIMMMMLLMLMMFQVHRVCPGRLELQVTQALLDFQDLPVRPDLTELLDREVHLDRPEAEVLQGVLDFQAVQVRNVDSQHTSSNETVDCMTLFLLHYRR